MPADNKETKSNGRSAAALRRASRRRNPSATIEDNTPLKPEEIDQYRQALLEKRRELLGDVDYMRGEALNGSRDGSSGDLSSMPIHMADIGTDNYEQEFTLGLIESDRKYLREIDLALAKIDEGTYGICEGTGKPIGRARLDARPEARYCVEYARMIEQGKATAISLEEAEDKLEGTGDAGGNDDNDDSDGDESDNGEADDD